MNQTQVNCTTCSHCDESFLSRGKYENHYKQKYQNQIQLDEGMTVLRSEDGKFICQCGKKFELGKSLKRHYGNCIKAYEKELENEQGKIYSFYLFY